MSPNKNSKGIMSDQSYIKETQEAAIFALTSLKDDLGSIPEKIIAQACKKNPWFSPFFIQEAANGIRTWLEEDLLRNWLGKYAIPERKTQVGIIMAGNIPLVGMHDLVAGLLSGCELYIAPSRRDKVLIVWVLEKIMAASPALKKNIHIVENLPQNIDLLIATGSDNAARYFSYQYQGVPCLIRRNRTSVAVLDEAVTQKDVAELAKDVFLYNGLGCRNVSHIIALQSFSKSLLTVWDDYPTSHLHTFYLSKFARERAKTQWLGQPHEVYGKAVLTPSSDFNPPPMGVIRFQQFDTTAEINHWLTQYQDRLQCVVGKNVPFGHSQQPKLYDYADGVDTMKFLRNRTLS
ncbi:MAG: acyl-CoA reductase [Bacteroidia bacterium]